ncbi:MAG: calcium-binding EGF-like domain-containing protein, partial [Myxococcota bacterium]|nr:calcium-binding EGF-like domain-containing protein [Myxococcota bacterium]
DVVVHERAAPDDGCLYEVTFKLATLALDDAQYEVRSYQAFAESLILKSQQVIEVNPNLTNEQTVTVEPCLPIAQGHHVAIANAHGDVRLAYNTEEDGLGYWTILENSASQVDAPADPFVRTVGDVAFKAVVDFDYPCANGAGCMDVLNGFACVCTDGFDGLYCENNIDECFPNPCVSGTCVDHINEYACVCDEGFEGTNCDVNIDDCVDQPCQNGATCVDGVASYVCECPAGFDGETCDLDIDDCADEPCQNGGECKDQVDAFTCVCALGYGGELCEVDIDDCATSPCQNGGTCEDLVADYQCACPAGYHGKDCDGEIDECSVGSQVGPTAMPTIGGMADVLHVSNEPVHLSGCVDEIVYRLGSAPPGNGTNWEIRSYSVDPYTREATLRSSAPLGQLTTFLNTPLTVAVEPCLPITAFDRVAVYNPDGALRLQHDPDFGDGFWTLETLPGDAIDGEPDVLTRRTGRPGFQAHVSHTIPCENGGACVDFVNAYTCNCAPGFSGFNCEINDDDCDPNPCQNGGTCKDGIASFTCECPGGYSGDTCDTNIDECDPNPC